MIPREPFAHQTFRCPRCGSSYGLGCNCWQREFQQKQQFKLDLPKVDAPLLPKLDLSLDKPLMKKPWEI